MSFTLESLKFEFLADRPEDVPTVLAWWQSVWGDRMGDLDAYTGKFLASLGKAELPLDIVATHEGNPVGTAALKEHELREIYPDYRFWMGSVFVAPDYRGQGVATQLASRIIELARQRRLPQIYLQTVDLSGGLYAELGWKPLERIDYRGEDTLIMVRRLD